MSAVIGMMMSLAVLLLFSGVQRIRAPGIREQIAQYGEAQRASAPQSRYGRWRCAWPAASPCCAA